MARFVVFAANGEYYARMWNRATVDGADVVSITSYNEWGEGTQIEPAIPRGNGDMYSNYETEGGPNAYLEKTRLHAKLFRESKRQHEAPVRSEL